MKRMLMMGALLLMGAGAYAQSGPHFKAGVNVGIPTGDVADLSSFTLGADVAYMWPVAPSLHVGVASGFQNFFVKSEFKDNDFVDLNYVPVAASGQFSVTPNFFVGADLGYAFTTSGGEDAGGFYYLPKVGYQLDRFEVFGGYRAVSSDVNFGAANIGVNFKF